MVLYPPYIIRFTSNGIAFGSIIRKTQVFPSLLSKSAIRV